MQITRPSTDRDRRWLGPTLVLTSAVFFSCSGVLTKAITADSWTILAWRGLVGGLVVAGHVALTRRRRGAPGRMRLDRGGWVLTLVGAVGSVAFISAFKHTFVANVSVIYATIPFVAAVLERVLLGERVRRRTMGAAVASMAGIGITVGASIGLPSLTGDLLAVAMVVINALYMVLIRTFPGSDAVLAGAASGGVLFVVGWLLSDPLAVSARDASLLVVFGIAFAVATIFWIEGTRRMPAAESGLLGSAETPIAIVLAWIVLSEVPPFASVIGAAIVFVAVFWHIRPDVAMSGRG